MRDPHIRVRVTPGLFNSERNVSFDAGDRKYNLVVDVKDLFKEDSILVAIVDETAEELLVDLPRETFTSGNRIRVPRGVVQGD